MDLAAHQATGQGRDSLFGIEDVVGSRHDDFLAGNSGVNLLAGGATRSGGPQDVGNDVLRGRKGIDFLYDYTCFGHCPLAAPSSIGGDRLRGGRGSDSFDLSGTHNRAIGGAGPDYFFVRDARVRMWGGKGGDQFKLGKGRAHIDGGKGEDRVRFSSLTVSAPQGPARVDLRAGTASDPKASATLARVENARGTTGDDVLLGDGAVNSFFGGNGDDSLRGRGGSDFLDGSEGVDDLNGGRGRDTCLNGEAVSNCEK